MEFKLIISAIINYSNVAIMVVTGLSPATSTEQQGISPRLSNILCTFHVFSCFDSFKLLSHNVQLTASFMRLIRSIPTVVLGVTHVAWWQTAPVGTLELSWTAGPLGTSLWVLVTAVWTVIYSIAVPGHRDALLVFTLELVFLASVVTYRDRKQLD